MTRNRRNKMLRENMVGADDLLDAIPLVHRLHERLLDRGLAGTAEAAEALNALERLRSLMLELADRKDSF
jgi:hypothetical protein